MSGVRLTFWGGAEAVTGSNFLIESDNSKLLVDCGIEQGADFSVQDSYGPFPYNPAEINALVLTHAHLDHVGRCPKLVKDGFRGRVFMTPATRDLAELILRDSIGILAQEAKRLHRDPLYAQEDVEEFLRLIHPLEYHTEYLAAPGLSIYLRDTGHILGSASVRIRADDGTSVAFTGDIGNSPSPYLPDAEPIPDADALFMESVYGDRLHPHRDDRLPELRSALQEAIKRGGTILMPAFSLERTQLMLYELSNMFAAKEIPQIPVYLDSPLAIAVTDVYRKWGSKYFKPAAQDELKREHDIFDFPFLTKTKSREDSEQILKEKGQKMIIAGAGMSHGGRIGRWEQLYLPDPATTLFIVGYQAPGSPGRLLQDGSPHVRIEGRDVPVKAKVVTLGAWSAHADRDGLVEFARHALPRTKTFFVGLGEPSSARFLAQRLHDYLGVRSVVPVPGEKWEVVRSIAKKIS